MEITAHWIYDLYTDANDSWHGGIFHCSNCKTMSFNGSSAFPSAEKFCHHCGAHMIETPVLEIEEYKGDKYTWE